MRNEEMIWCKIPWSLAWLFLGERDESPLTKPLSSIPRRRRLFFSKMGTSWSVRLDPGGATL